MSDIHDALKFRMDAFFRGQADLKCGIQSTTIAQKLANLGRVTDAEFEVIEPTTEKQDEHRESAGDGTNTGSPGFKPRAIHEIFDHWCGSGEG